MSETEIERLKAELRETRLAYHAAVQMGQFKAGFLARTSHELRSPLNSLIGLHQLILSDLCESPQEEREFIQQAHKASYRLLKLLDEVIYVAKLQYGAQPLELDYYSLQSILNEVQHRIHLHAANRSYPLEIESPDPDITVYADFQKLVQGLSSLLDVAIALMEDGQLKLTAQPYSDGQYAEILLEVYSSKNIWSEPLDTLDQGFPEITLEKARNLLEKPIPSPEMSFLLSQDLLILMNGKLNLLASPSQEEQFTRLQCLIPLTPPAPPDWDLLND